MHDEIEVRSLLLVQKQICYLFYSLFILMIFILHDFKLGVLLENGIILLAGEHFQMTYL